MAEPYLGEIRLFAGSYAPANWAFCDGSVLPINSYTALYSVIGTTYGGDGISTFGLPDLRGRIPLSQGQGLGLTPRVAGQNGGTENVTLLTANMPAHNHLVNASTVPATTGAAGPTVVLAAAASTTSGETDVRYLPAAQTVKATVALNSREAGNAGGGQPHDNIMPSLAITFIIALFGIFPSAS